MANFIYARGRRKTAVARIRLFKKPGDTIINNLPIAKYFPGAIAKKMYEEPWIICNVLDKYHATIKVVGSGKYGQLDAVVHGLSRALTLVNPAFRSLLKKRGLLTRDPRTRQRRMIGMGGKSRRQKQSPKR
ncbi:MAG: 30S ribosomal protein S9 [Candidatus Beckwithbacteria bacterium GW2011_GWA2_43_10]|uniref:Small ribosomal subunit protein uS9 n=1 Tax=Candidatus Beckwithbacteria bacterium GW2011_GWA2_43_10 TaxID=1618369 RepID=A0A0G1EC62_9BACT|nr:MAG: 30S ribosomal protein S9 [Candidatus Beckwithbacteria bacterium GW2011_GWA2_43_10]